MSRENGVPSTKQLKRKTIQDQQRDEGAVYTLDLNIKRRSPAVQTEQGAATR